MAFLLAATGYACDQIDDPRSPTELVEWTTEEAPVLRIGAQDGPAEYALHRVSDLALTSSGDFVVANGGTELRYYSPDGRYLRTAGGRGSGPGEFVGLSTVGILPGDTIIAVDRTALKRTWFSPNGDLVREEQLRVRRSGHGIQPTLAPGGRLLLSFTRPPAERAGAVREEVVHTFLTPSGRLDTIGQYAGFENWRPAGNTSSALPRPFARWSQIATASERIFIGDNARPEIEVFEFRDADAESVALVRVASIPTPYPMRPTTEADLEEFFHMRMSSSGGPVETHGATAPETMPGYGRIIADNDDRLWVEEYEWRPSQWSTWTVLSTEGRAIARIRTHRGLRIMWIDGERIIGSERDSLNVEYITAYRYRRH